MADQWILLGPLRCHSANLQSLAANAASLQSLVWQCLRRGTLILAASKLWSKLLHTPAVTAASGASSVSHSHLPQIKAEIEQNIEEEQQLAAAAAAGARSSI